MLTMGARNNDALNGCNDVSPRVIDEAKDKSGTYGIDDVIFRKTYAIPESLVITANAAKLCRH